MSEQAEKYISLRSSMKTRKDKIISFTLSDELLKMLDMAVNDYKTNRSHILRMCIRQTLETVGNDKEDI